MSPRLNHYAILSYQLVLICHGGLSNYMSVSYFQCLLLVTQQNRPMAYVPLARNPRILPERVGSFQWECGDPWASHRCPWKSRIQADPFMPGLTSFEKVGLSYQQVFLFCLFACVMQPDLFWPQKEALGYETAGGHSPKQSGGVYSCLLFQMLGERPSSGKKTFFSDLRS